MKIVKFIFFFPPLILIACSFYFLFLFSAPSKNSQKERLIFKQNAKEEEIIGLLQEKKFFRSRWIFEKVLGFKKWQDKIQPGAYEIPRNLNAYQLAKLLIAGPYQKWVTIPPGKRKEQTAVILQRALGWPDDMVKTFSLVAKEGYLFPDTYLINVDSDPKQVFQKLENNFNDRFDLDLQKQLLAKNIKTETAIKFASLIERESGGDEDKPIIAGIIWNRLDKGMKLEIDATVQYAITSEKLIANSEKLWKDFNFWEALPPNTVRKINSPYNTYLVKGLPAGPICTPSLASLKAVANPSQTDALYYLHSPDKKIHTAKTYKEHQENIRKYL